MEEGQERDSSSDEERVLIEDEDMEDSPVDTPGLWIPERNEDDTKVCESFWRRYSDQETRTGSVRTVRKFHPPFNFDTPSVTLLYFH
jgi:hypothetical protein